MVVQNGGKDRVDEQERFADLVHSEHGRWLSIEYISLTLPRWCCSSNGHGSYIYRE